MSSSDMFWKIIDESREDAADLDEQVNRLVALLSEFAPGDILEFQHVFDQRVRDAYRWDLWAVAYIINGGCSDDGFDYFLGWLIAQGREYYEAALADPERAGDRVSPGDVAECEEMWYVAAEAYESTGKDDFYELALGIPRTIQGERWEEDEVYELFPSLAQKFAT